RRVEIEVDSDMNAALTEVTVQRRVVAVLVEERPQIAEIVADVLHRNGRVLPSLPRIRLAWNERGCTQTSLSYLPDLLLYLRLDHQSHRRRVAQGFEMGRDLFRAGARFIGRLAREFRNEKPAALRHQPRVFRIDVRTLHV